MALLTPFDISIAQIVIPVMILGLSFRPTLSTITRLIASKDSRTHLKTTIMVYFLFSFIDAILAFRSQAYTAFNQSTSLIQSTSTAWIPFRIVERCLALYIVATRAQNLQHSSTQWLNRYITAACIFVYFAFEAIGLTTSFMNWWLPSDFTTSGYSTYLGNITNTANIGALFASDIFNTVIMIWTIMNFFRFILDGKIGLMNAANVELRLKSVFLLLELVIAIFALVFTILSVSFDASLLALSGVRWIGLFLQVLNVYEFGSNWSEVLGNGLVSSKLVVPAQAEEKPMVGVDTF